MKIVDSDVKNQIIKKSRCCNRPFSQVMIRKYCEHNFFYSSFYSCVLDAQKNSVIETILLRTHNIRIG